MSKERETLVAMARQLELLATERDDADPEFQSLLAAFNEQTKATCTHHTFEFLYTAEEPGDLVERLLEIRDAPPLPPTPSHEQLLVLVTKAHGEGAIFVDGEHAGEALARASKLPHDIAHQLGSGFGQMYPGWPSAEEIVAFATSYLPPSTPDALRDLCRRWLDDEAHERVTCEACLGGQLLLDAVQRIDVPSELQPLVRAQTSSNHIRAVAKKKAMILLGLTPPGTRPNEDAERAPSVESEPEVERYRHPSFGEGILVRRQDDKLLLRFSSGERLLLARFVTRV